MADIRIKDLTTLESASLTGDVFVIDGTTGTRKLSAFSPTFGGNATVTGTLTVNGATLTSTGDISVAADKGIYLKQGNVHKWTSDGTSSGTSRADIYADSGGAFFIRTGGATQALTISSGQGATFAGAVGINSTTASTTTSTGALVVSGGVGVGGSVNINNNLTLGYASLGDSVLKIIRSYGGNEWLQIAGWSAGSLGNNAYSIDAVNGGGARPVYFRRSTDAGSTYTNFLTWDTSNNATFAGNITIDKAAPDFTLTRSANTNSGLIQLTTSTTYDFAIGLRNTTDSDLHIYNYGTSNDALKIARATSAVTLNATTASTSTSSGALVVSGGVGVAGAIYVGGAGDFAGQLNLNSGTASAPSLKLNSTNNGIYYTGSNIVRIAANGAEAATFGGAAATVVGSFQTGAPAGGTAAAWKLGSVASVSPTSPNRTIEVDIGGTIYYIHAKTTNN